MRILILTQAVDTDDLVLGFFHRWIEVFSKKYEHVTVICLKSGKYQLPANVTILSLGKEKNAPDMSRLLSRLRYIWNFYKYIFRFRKDYDAVFVHMNEEYVMLAGPIWRLLGKKVVFWRNFRTGSWMTPIAARIANVVCYTSNDSFTARYRNSRRMPIGIDTEIFQPPEKKKDSGSILFFGRLDSLKKVDLFIESLKCVNSKFSADIYGDPTYKNSTYFEEIINQAKPLVDRGVLKFYPGVTNKMASELFKSHAIYVNLTLSGSFDKTIGEAMACGGLVICLNNDVKGVLPEMCQAADNAQSVARAIDWALALSYDERQKISSKLRKYIVENHALNLLSERIFSIMQ